MAEDIKTAVKIFKARIKDMGDEEVKREYEKLVKKFGKRNVDKELGLEEKLVVKFLEGGVDSKGFWIKVDINGRIYKYWLKDESDVEQFHKYLKYTPGRAINFIKKVAFDWERISPPGRKAMSFVEQLKDCLKKLKEVSSFSTVCPRCMGSGTFQGVVCSKCKGTGVFSESKMHAFALREQLSIKEIEEVQNELYEVIEMLSRVVIPVTVYEDAMKKLSSIIRKAEQYKFPFEFVRDLKDYYKEIVSFAEKAVDLSTKIDDWISEFEDFIEESFKK